MLNRSLPPAANTIDHLIVKEAETIRMKNGIPLHWINAGEHDILQLEIILRSGKWYETLQGTSFFASKMLGEGTQHKSSSDISEFFESFGVQFQINPGIDFITLSAFTLNKHFKKIIPVLAECLFEPSFPPQELNILKDLQIQQIRVNNEKGSYLAAKEFRKLIFGENHPYGTQLEIADIGDHITSDLLKDYHSRQLLNQMELIITGKIGEPYLDVLKSFFGAAISMDSASPGERNDKPPVPVREKGFIKPGSLQNSIRYGKKIISKTHPDHIGFIILNELLGGFFGSRLMKNIREEKGYTYGIHSSVVNYIHDSYFVISTDVIKGHTRPAIEEINKEIIRLQTERIGNNELDTVRNYMLGGFLSSLETSFSLAEKFKSVYFHGLGYDFYDRYISTIKNITPGELQDLAVKYLNLPDFSLVIVGEEK